MTDNNFSLSETAKNLVDPIDKLIETVARGVGRIYEPVHIRRKAKAKAVEIQTISATIRDNDDIPMCYADGVVNIDATNTRDIALRAAMRIEAQELRKQQNIENVVSFAKNELIDSEKVSAETVNPDWTTRFMNSVEDIGDEEMQKLWGKILAGEVKKPNSFSLRTLDCVKNLSRQEAQLFYKVAPYFICIGGDVFLPRDSELLDKVKVNFREVLKLEDCGLIAPDSNLTLTFKITSNDNDNPFIASGSDAIVLFSLDSQSQDAKVIFNQYNLTVAGRELYGALHANNSRDYLILYAKYLKRTLAPKSPKISVHAITERHTDGRISYDCSDILSTS